MYVTQTLRNWELFLALNREICHGNIIVVSLPVGLSGLNTHVVCIGGGINVF